MSDFFSSSDQAPAPVTTLADPYGAVRNPLVNTLGSQIGKPGQSYSGELVAPTDSQQNQSLTALGQYANRAPSPTYQSGENQINKTINGNYDPSTSPYYQAIKAQSAQNMQATNRQIDNQTAGGGQYWGGQRGQEQQQAATSNNNNLNSTLAGLQQQNTQNQVALTPYALQAGQNDMNAPLQTAAALQQYGALPQAYQQALDTANYQNWQSANIQQPLAIEQLAAQVQQAPLYGQDSYQASPFSQIVNSPLSGPALQSIGNFTNSMSGQPLTAAQSQQLQYTNGYSPYSSSSFMSGPVSLSGY